MAGTNGWMNVERKSASKHPYPARNVFPQFNDAYDRDLRVLLMSMELIANFGSLDIHHFEGIETDELGLVLRICRGCVTFEDFDFLLQFIRVDPKQTVLNVPISRSTRLNDIRDDLPDLRMFTRTIFPFFDTHGRWAICDVDLNSRSVEAYFIGNHDDESRQETASLITTILRFKFPTSTFSLRSILEVPSTYPVNPTLLAYLLIYHVNLRGQYLDLDGEKIIFHKFELLRSFVKLHDGWLGKLSLERIEPSPRYPFIYTGYEDMDGLHELKTEGWYPIDVVGDGNCGFYSLLLGMENVGLSQFSPDNDNSTATRMIDHTPWQSKVIEFRQCLQSHSELLLQSCFTEEVIPKLDWWWWLIAYIQVEPDPPEDESTAAGVPENESTEELCVNPPANIAQNENNSDDDIAEDDAPTEDVTLLTEAFVVPDLDKSAYFEQSFLAKTFYHMNPFWASAVTASLFEVDVVLITRETAPPSAPGKPLRYTWSTTTFAYAGPMRLGEGHLKVEQQAGIHRRSDVDFFNTPTIEILFLTGYKAAGDEDNQHFQFLRRVRVHRVTEPRDDDVPRLRDVLRQSLDVSPQHESNLEDAAEVDRENSPKKTNKTKKRANKDDTVSNAPKKKNKSVKDHTVNTVRAPATKTKATGKKPRKVNPLEIEEESTEDKPTKTKDTDKTTKDSNRTKSKQEELTELTAWFDAQYEKDALKHKTASRMYFNPANNTFWTSRVKYNGKGFTVSRQERNLDGYDESLINAARENPGIWVGCSLGDPGLDEAPKHLCTRVVTLYQQHSNPYCLTHSLASALFYCGFREAGRILSSLSPVFSTMTFDNALSSLRGLMLNLVPLIGSPTLFGIRTKKHNRPKRTLTWDMLFSDIGPFPTVIIPVLPDGRTSHAFCVVDDLIFDSITSYALKLNMDSVRWIYNDVEPNIYQAYRFNTKYSPPGTRIPGRYDRTVVFH